jgi:cellulose biosynthesis protein BcsQ
MKTVTFFNNKGGVGKTALVYHVAWMCSELGEKVLAVDLDPQANLTSMFLNDSRLQALWPDEGRHKSILNCVAPILEGLGDINDAHIEQITANLHLIAGDLGLSSFEDRLSEHWPKCLASDKAAFRVMTAFYRVIYRAVQKVDTDVVLIDVGPNLGAINRAAIIASNHVIMPLAPGLFSLQGLKNLGPTFKEWRSGWKKRLDEKPSDLNIPMPLGKMAPAGYIVMQHVERKNRPVKAFQNWVDQIPSVYNRYILNSSKSTVSIHEDENRIGLIKNYQSLMPMAQDARKPIFLLKPSDGAIGAHAQSVSNCYSDFKRLTNAILQKVANDAGRLPF